jgi:hypothetical protein
LTGQVRAEEKEHTPPPEPTKIKGRVRATPTQGKPTAGGRRVTDAKLCQDLAYLFEGAEGQERYPLKVDHLQGSDYFGCDLLSFATQEDRDSFELTPNENLVQRFIEVKGRGSEKGSIGLEGNEFESSRRNVDRYYVYRVYKKADGMFEVVVLNDPLSSYVNVTYEIDLFRDTRTMRYEVDVIE